MAQSNTTCAVTGASGFVGRNLLQHLRSRGIAAVALDRTNTPDFSDREILKKRFSGCRTVVHLLGRAHILRPGNDAAGDLAAFRRVNVDLALTAAQAAADAGVEQFVYISSVSVFGALSASHPINDASPISPVTPYGVSKAEAEDALEAFADRSGLSVLSLRPPLVYGPGAPGNFARLVSAIRRGWPLPFGSTTDNRRTFIAAENLSEAIGRALARSNPLMGRFIVADNESLSTRDTMEAIAKGIGRPARLLPLPSGLTAALLSTAGKGAMAQQLFGSLEFDGAALFRALDWRPSVSPREGLAAMGRAAA